MAPAHAAVGLRAVVEADDRRRAVCDRHDRRLRDLPHGIQHGHDADINIAAEREQRRVARDLHEAVRERHHKARNAECRDAPDAGEIRLKAAEAYFSSACLPVRKRSTHSAESICEMTVAMAAPRTPRCRTKIKTGSSTMFAAAPTTTVSMPIFAKP